MCMPGKFYRLMNPMGRHGAKHARLNRETWAGRAVLLPRIACPICDAFKVTAALYRWIENVEEVHAKTFAAGAASQSAPEGRPMRAPQCWRGGPVSSWDCLPRTRQ
jgi:hypothetical protein